MPNAIPLVTFAGCCALLSVSGCEVDVGTTDTQSGVERGDGGDSLAPREPAPAPNSDPTASGPPPNNPQPTQTSAFPSPRTPRPPSTPMQNNPAPDSTPAPSNSPLPAPEPTSVGGGGGPTSPSDECVPDYDCDPEPPDTGDPYADCVTRINQFRSCVCLPPLQRNDSAEGCLNEQAEYDSSNGAHAGFSDRICDPNGNAQNECPGWGSRRQVIDGCIRMMFYEGPPAEEPCEGKCYSDHGHFINMTSTRSTSVACGFYDDGDEVWAVQNFFR